MGRRVVSLLPSTTEVVAALGHGDTLVGRSHECDFPEGVLDLPAVSRPRRDPVGSSGQVNRTVMQMLEQVLSIYEVDTDALRRADPDLIITQDLCRVCAVAEDEVVQAARAHLAAEVEVLTSSPLTLADVFSDALRIGDALGDRPAAERLVASMRSDLADLAATASQREPPRLTVLDWADPLMAAGNWVPELIQVAGAVPAVDTAGGHAAVITAEDLHAADPDAILVAPCGYGLARAVADGEVLAGLPGWADLRAVRDGRVAFADGSAYFNRPGPRLVDSAAIVMAVAHGIGPAMTLEGRAWLRWA